MSDRKEFAVTITAKETAELLPIERDTAPLAPNEIVGRTLVTLVSAGTEVNWCYLGTSFPTTPGYACICEVEAVGSDVTNHKPGDVVFCMGGHRSYQRVSQEMALPVPSGLSPEKAVFARLMGVTMSTLTTTQARPPQKVLITGLGLVGHLAAKVFTACGYEVLGVDPSEARRTLLGQAQIATSASVPLDDPAVAGQVTLVLECAGHDQAALDGCNVIRKGGEVVLVGTPWRRYTDRTAFDLTHAIFHKYAVVRSGWEWEVPLTPVDFKNNSINGNIAAAMRWISDGRVDVEGLWKTAAPSEAQTVYQALLHANWPALGAVFDWR